MGVNVSRHENQTEDMKYLLQTLSGHKAGVNCMAFNEDGSVLATGSEDCTARLWSKRDEKWDCVGILKGHDLYIKCLVIEDNYVITGSADKTLRKWDVDTCRCVFVFRGHLGPVNRILCTGDFIFSSSNDKTVRCWDVDTFECIRVFTGHKSGTFPLLYIPANEEEATPETYNWNGNMDIVISGSADTTARSWSFETGKCLQVFEGHSGAILCVSTDSSCKNLYTGGQDHTIRSWDIVTGQPIKIFEGHQAAVLHMVLIDGLLFSSSSDHTVRAWVTDVADCTRIYKGHRHSVGCFKHYDGLLFTGSGDKDGAVFDVNAEVPKEHFRGHTGTVNKLEIMDGKLFTASNDGDVKIWDVSDFVKPKKEDTNHDDL